MKTIATCRAHRYVVPLREGGSLPAIVETEDGEQYVVKFRGSGQGAKALIAELIVGLLARRLELSTPDLALIELDECFARLEPDPEIQDILRGSHGTNVGLKFLEGAFNFDPISDLTHVGVEQASATVALDALTWNIDRTARNPNLMVQHKRTWLIDHGAALYVHHDWQSLDDERIGAPFAQLADHVLLARAGQLELAAKEVARRLDGATIEGILACVPDALLLDAPRGVLAEFENAQDARAAYVDLLQKRVSALPRVLGLDT